MHKYESYYIIKVFIPTLKTVNETLTVLENGEPYKNILP